MILILLVPFVNYVPLPSSLGLVKCIHLAVRRLRVIVR
jgi:hypothetical protein